MKRPAIRRTGICLLGLTFAGAAVIVAACSGDEPIAPITAPDGSTPGVDSSTLPPPDSDGASDGAVEDPDAGFEDDGGHEVVDDDGGVIADEDGGFDGGTACASLKSGTIIETTCGNRIALWGGGDLVTATYQLAAIHVIGDKTFCQDAGTYETAEHRGALQVTATSPTQATFEFVDQGREKSTKIGDRPAPFATRRYDVLVQAKDNALSLTADDCKLTSPPRSALYSTGKNVLGKRTLTIRLPYTKPGTRVSTVGVYRYVEP